VSPVKYELGIYIPEIDILHSDRRENQNSYIAHLTFSRGKAAFCFVECECVSAVTDTRLFANKLSNCND
jgi:hypothetical protein